MKEILVLTRSVPEHPEEAVHGVFRRQGIFFAALAPFCERIHLLGFTNGSTSTGKLADTLSAQTGHPFRVTLAPRTPNPPDRGMMRLYGPGIFSADRQDHYENIGHPLQVEAVRKALADRPRLIFAHRLHVFTPLLAAAPDPALPVLFDMDDIEHRSLARRLVAQPAWPSERMKLLHLPALMIREARALHRARESYVCSDSDAQILKRLFGCSRVEVVANSAPAPDTPPPFPEQPNLGFIGSFSHPPNLDAAQSLIREIWPRIHRALPRAQLLIAGAGAREALGALATQPGVRVMNFVKDLNDFYSQVSLLCAPIRFGAGTRVKIVEAAAWQRAHVTTALGAEGLAFEPGREIAIGNTAESLAGQCIELLEADGATRLGNAARLRHSVQYDRGKIVAALSARISLQLEDQ